MLRFSANISTLFLEHAELQRPQAARVAGFDAVEIQFPYEHTAAEWAEALGDARVSLAVINAPAGDLLHGGPGLAAMPGREGMFQQAVRQAADYARILRPRCVNILAGWPPADLDRALCLKVLAQNLRFAAEMLTPLGVRVVVEACNVRDRPGYLISRTDEALALIAQAGHPNIGMQYDLYHMQIMEGDLIRTLQRAHPHIGHIQFADNPGRHEPGTGEIRVEAVFDAIAALPYEGYVGAEYLPSRRTEDTLGWLPSRTKRGQQVPTLPEANATTRGSPAGNPDHPDRP